MASLEKSLSILPQRFRRSRLPTAVLTEAKKRVLDSIGCFFGAYQSKPSQMLRDVYSTVQGPVILWGTHKKSGPDTAATINGTGVRALDFNDTYLSKEPCHPSDLLASLWAACEISKSKTQGRDLIKGLILGYDVMCRLCNATSLRKRGWDHVTFLPIASAVACSAILKISPEKTRNAIALSIVGQNALRQTRVGTISDWKATCAAYAARAGLMGALLAQKGFTGPFDIFSGRHGFIRQVAGSLRLSVDRLGKPWMIMRTHTKFFPAEHHSQSAIAAALLLRKKLEKRAIKNILIETFGVSVDIIGSEPEKWIPKTRETADHSLPYLVCAALLDGKVTLGQYKSKRFKKPDVIRLMKKVKIKESNAMNRLYPQKLPVQLTLTLSGGRRLSQRIDLPRGYAGNPMSKEEVVSKFQSMASRYITKKKMKSLVGAVYRLEKCKNLQSISKLMVTKHK